MKIAIAGGTSPTLGASLVNAILANGKHTPIILTRDTSKTPTSHPDIETRRVDYTSIPSLTAALHEIHTVISVLLIPGPEMKTYQLNLLAAAEKAGVKRFAPSEYTLPPAGQLGIDFDKIKLETWDVIRESVESGRIDAARFPTGMFMNYLAIGAPFKQNEGLAGFAEGPFLVHLNEDKPWVEVPVLSNPKGGVRYPRITMTDIRDIGRFIAGAIEMEEPWGGRVLGMAGETMGLGGLVGVLERWVGKKVEIRELTEDELGEVVRTAPPEEFMKRMEAQISLAGCRDAFVVEPTLNGITGVKPMSISGFVERYWGGIE